MDAVFLDCATENSQCEVSIKRINVEWVVVAVDEHSADTYVNSYFYGQNGKEWYVVRCKYYAFDMFHIFA